MKAWIVKEKDEFCCTVVFAENRNKAKKLALSTQCCEDVPYIDIKAIRCPEADKQYRKGKTEMDWDNPNDRLFLVKELGLYCEYVEPPYCEKCAGKEYCDSYQNLLSFSEELEEVERESNGN